jgi:hypothetical protein
VKRYYTTGELSRMLGGLSRGAIIRQARAGSVPGLFVVGKRLYFWKEQVEPWIAALGGTLLPDPATAKPQPRRRRGA